MGAGGGGEKQRATNTTPPQRARATTATRARHKPRIARANETAKRPMAAKCARSPTKPRYHTNGHKQAPKPLTLRPGRKMRPRLNMKWNDIPFLIHIPLCELKTGLHTIFEAKNRPKTAPNPHHRRRTAPHPAAARVRPAAAITTGHVPPK